MRHFSSDALIKMFTPKEIIDIVEKGINKYAEGKYIVPERMHIKRGESTNLIMPAFGKQYYCTKLISVDPKNHQNQLPIISGLLVLNDSNTGETVATMDASMITALRTGAVGSIGLNIICDKDIDTLGIIGLGVQGYWQTLFAVSSRHITTIYCYSRSQSRFDVFQKKVTLKFPNIAIVWCSTAEEVVRNSPVVVACTTSKNPVFNTEGLDISNKRFVSVGSFAKDMQELPDEVYKQADALIIDSDAAKTEVGDVLNSTKNNWISDTNILSLAELALGKKTIDNHKNFVFKSVGMAAFDLALAVAAYERNS